MFQECIQVEFELGRGTRVEEKGKTLGVTGEVEEKEMLLRKLGPGGMIGSVRCFGEVKL